MAGSFADTSGGSELGALQLIRHKPWACAAVETQCADELDNDCDGSTDADDSDCQGALLINEIQSNSPDFVEIINRSSERLLLAGLTVTYSNCSSGVTSYTFPSHQFIDAGVVRRVVDSDAGLLIREHYTDENICDNDGDSQWYALCAGPCDLITCGNFLDYVEKSDGTPHPERPACASVSPAPIDVSSQTAGTSVSRVGYTGIGAAAQSADWVIGPPSRD